VVCATRPPTLARTFGLQRLEILAAVVNAVVLLVFGILILVEAIRRLVTPGHPSPGAMVLFGLVAVLGNGVSLLLLRRGHAASLTVRGAYLEVLADLLGAAGVLLAAAVIAATGWERADPVASLLLGVLIVPGVVGCHDLHAWTITSGSAVLSAHVVVADELWANGSSSAVLDRLAECLAGHFDLEHSTFQLEQPGHVDHEAVLHD
jgi:cobalt-zinc-cadmium efflux system protein